MSDETVSDTTLAPSPNPTWRRAEQPRAPTRGFSFEHGPRWTAFRSPSSIGGYDGGRSPAQIMGRFNGFLKSVILSVSEARDLGDVNRYSFYAHMKGYTAATPDVRRIDEKHLREYSIFNVCGAIITTNHKAAASTCQPMIVGISLLGQI